ncbi:MAG TPA: hypothetical protein VJU02_00255 [Nitrospiraceae bacterium]|nr:hypothetical protein [Nitrospiraceae bacterium]
MKHLVIGIVLIWAIFQLSSFIWSSKGQSPSPLFSSLVEPPQYRLTNPYENGYFYLLGFAAETSLDPVKVGHEMWLEIHSAHGLSEFNYEIPGRSALQIQVPIEEVLPSWNSENPMGKFRDFQEHTQTMSGRDRALLTRYEHWLMMPFEDMGFGHRGTPRFVEVFVAHRLYIAGGFSRQTALGMQRLKQDIQVWRNILRDATTISTKVMAQIVITDNLNLLSNLLSQRTVNQAVLAMALNIAPPLTTAEASLQWPLRHQFTLGVHDNDSHTFSIEKQTQSFSPQERWLANTARLPEQAFRLIAHPHRRSFLGIPLQTRETWEMYATYYDAIIHATEAGQSTLPKIHELAGTSRNGTLENFISPDSFEPDWDPFQYQLRETDARLRLASLQAVLHYPSPQSTVPNRLAQVGSGYYDPFSGLPMLWSQTQHKIYSVGRDRYDDGGDPTFDISVPAIVSHKSAANESHPPTLTLRTNRR